MHHLGEKVLTYLVGRSTITTKLNATEQDASYKWHLIIIMVIIDVGRRVDR